MMLPRAIWYASLAAAWALSIGQAMASPGTGARRLFSGDQEALGAFAIDIDRDGVDELVVIGDGEVMAYHVASGAVAAQWPLPAERPTIAKFATGYYVPASGELVFRASTRLGGSRLTIAAKAVSWDAEPNYPMCVGEALRATEDASAFLLGDERMRWLRCGELLQQGRRLQWRGALSPASALRIDATWCAETSCETPVTWGPFAGSGNAFTVGARGGQLYVATASAVPQGEGGDVLAIWAASGAGRKLAPLWTRRFAAGILALVVVTHAPDATSRLVVVSRFLGARRFDVWEVVW